jgi:hypothetical protein
MNRRFIFFIILGCCTLTGIIVYQRLTNNPSIPYASCITESNTIADVLKFVDEPNTIVIFDIDNTLIHPNQELGSDQWFSYMMKEKFSQGLSAEQALAVVLPLFYQVHDYIKMYLAEPSTAQVVNNLFGRSIDTIALTSRSFPLIEKTEEQLKLNGISFKKSAKFNKELSCTLTRPAKLRHGIIYCNNNDKGKTLLDVLQLCHCQPQKIVFVDDKINHLFEVERECLANHIKFVGIRYGALDNFVAQFDPIRAHEQLTALLSTQLPINFVT